MFHIMLNERREEVIKSKGAHMFTAVENNINWLAQCKRRMRYPIDQSDRAGLSAFEYGWKCFNNIYAELKSNPDRQKMYDCIEKYLDREVFFRENKKDLQRFCEIDHKIYLADENYNSLNPSLSPKVEELYKSILDCNFIDTPKRLIDCLYVVRNARVHGSFGTGKVSFVYLPKSIFTLNILKGACTVLRGGGGSNAISLPDRLFLCSGGHFEKNITPHCCLFAYTHFMWVCTITKSYANSGYNLSNYGCSC